MNKHFKTPEGYTMKLLILPPNGYLICIAMKQIKWHQVWHNAFGLFESSPSEFAVTIPLVRRSYATLYI